MKSFFLILIMFFISAAHAQLDSRGGVTPLEGLDKVDEEVNAEERKEINFQFSKNHSLSNSNSFFMPTPTKRYFSDEKPKETNLHTATAGFQEHTIDFEPRYLKKDREIKESYRKNQSLGSIRTSSITLTLMYRDHEYVDGDRVRVFVNGELVRDNIILSGGWQGITYELNSGINKVVIEALNQGTSGPNTAAFKVTDDDGSLLASNEWNLTTGYTATLVVVKE